MMTNVTKINKRIKQVHVREVLGTLWHDLFKEPFYLLTHPIKGFWEFKHEGRRKNYVAIFYLTLMCITQIIAYNHLGFLINRNNPTQFNALRIILLVVVPVLLITIGNWSVTTLFSGKGSMLEIFSVITYSFAPYTWVMLPTILLSNYVVLEEVVFVSALMSFAVILMIYMAFFGLLVIHEYGLLKSIVTLMATAVSIGVIIFVVFLILTIFQQVYSFFYSIYREYIMRYL